MSAPRFATSSGDGHVRRALVLVGVLVFVPIVMFAPRGGDGETAAERSASGASSSRGAEGSEDAGRFPLRTDPVPEGAEPEGETFLLPEQGVRRPPGSPPPGL